MSLSLAPEVHPGWRGFRVAYALAVGVTWLGRAPQLRAIYSVESLVVQASDPLVAWSPVAVWGWWAALMVGLGLVGWGRWHRAGAALVLLAMIAFRVGNPDHEFMYDQLALWQCLALLFAPAGPGPGSPFGRYVLTLTYVGMYAGTGLSKLSATPTWLFGAPLATWLVDAQFGGGELARWLSVQPAALAVMGFVTILFEAGFTLALLHPWTRRAWLVLGAGMHVGIAVLLNVYTFSFVALAAWPLLLSAADAAALARWIGAALSRTRRRPPG